MGVEALLSGAIRLPRNLRLAKIKAYPHPHAEKWLIPIARGADEELP